MKKNSIFIGGLLVLILGIVMIVTPYEIKGNDTKVPGVASGQFHENDTSHILSTEASLPKNLKNNPKNSISKITSSRKGDMQPLPDAIADSVDRQSLLSLWGDSNSNEKTLINNIPATILSSNPEAINSLHVGQLLEIPIPSLNQSLISKIESTHNQINNVEVYKGSIANGSDKDNIIITKGKISTYVVIATSDGVFSGVIDNESGEVVLTDEADVNDKKSSLDDTVTIPGSELEAPKLQD